MTAPPGPAAARSIFALAVLLATGCWGDGETVTPTVHEVTGDTAARVARAARILAHLELPSPLHDAQWLEMQYGDGVLGPSDFTSFAMLEVAVSELPRWTDLLQPIENRPRYREIEVPRSWWVTPEEFEGLRFYEPGPLGGGRQGWVGISPERGRIYLYTWTT